LRNPEHIGLWITRHMLRQHCCQLNADRRTATLLSTEVAHTSLSDLQP